MYKKQMTVQKILCLAAIIVSGVFFLYSLGIMTDLYDSLYTTMRNPNNINQTSVPGSQIYYYMQDFNNTLLMCSIGLILLAVLLYVTNTHVRRRYYIGNFFATGAFTVASVAMSVYGHTYIEAYKQFYLTNLDFAALKEFAEMWGTLYTDSTLWFDLHYLVFGLMLVVSALLVCNAVWKVNLMKDEAKLVEEGRGAAA